MRHRIGTRVEIVSHEDKSLIGKKGFIDIVGFNYYCVRIDDGALNTGACYETEVKAIEKETYSVLENYGRILLPMLHGTTDSPKMVYYSSTKRSVYMMNKMLDSTEHFEVCVVRMAWDSAIQDYSLDQTITETYKLKQPYDMTNVINAFRDFLVAHINHDAIALSNLLWKET